MAALELIQVRQFPGAESSIHLKKFSCRASSITEGSYLENFDCRISSKESLLRNFNCRTSSSIEESYLQNFQHLKMNELHHFKSFNRNAAIQELQLKFTSGEVRATCGDQHVAHKRRPSSMGSGVVAKGTRLSPGQAESKQASKQANKQTGMRCRWRARTPRVFELQLELEGMNGLSLINDKMAFLYLLLFLKE